MSGTKLNTGRIRIGVAFVLAGAVLVTAMCVAYLNVVPRADGALETAIEAATRRSDEELTIAVSQFTQVVDLAGAMNRRIVQSPESRGPLCHVLAEASRQRVPAYLLDAADALLEHRRELTSLELCGLVEFFGEQPLERSLRRLEQVWNDENCDRTSRMLSIRAIGLKGEATVDAVQRAAAVAALHEALSIDDCELRITTLVAIARVVGARDPDYASRFKQVLEDCPELTDDDRVAYLREFYPPE